MPPRVIVVGAGPVGLLLAGELRLGGAEVTVVERRTERSTESRASTLHARTMEIFDGLGLLDRIGALPNDRMGHFGGIPLDLSEVDSPHPGQWKLLQTETERHLEEWAAGLGAEIVRGAEARILKTGSDGIEVDGPGLVAPVRAAYVVGCDGEDSTVRAAAGIAFPGHAATRELLRADVAGIEIRNRRFERPPAGFVVAARRPDGVTRVMMHRRGHAPVHRSGPPSFAEVAAVWAEITGEDIGHGTPLWLNAFDNTNRQAERYRHGRVLLAGDAAHAQMPIGGQALNLGLADAHDLGPKLAAVVTGRRPESLLDTYHATRHAAGRAALSGIRAQEQLLLGGPEMEPQRTLITGLMALPSVRRELASRIAGLAAPDSQEDSCPAPSP